MRAHTVPESFSMESELESLDVKILCRKNTKKILWSIVSVHEVFRLGGFDADVGLNTLSMYTCYGFSQFNATMSRVSAVYRCG